MYFQEEFEKFLKSYWGLEIRKGGKLIFRSKKSGVRGLLDFIKKQSRDQKDLVVFDKIVGRGAALLSVYANAKIVYAETGSRPAANVLRKYKIAFSFQKTIPNILNKDRNDICPLEKLSSKKKPEKFYKCLI